MSFFTVNYEFRKAFNDDAVLDVRLNGLLDLAEAKLEKCKLRVWPTPTNDEPVEHVRGIHD